MYEQSILLSNILIWAENQEPILYEDVRFFICSDGNHISLNVKCGKIPSELNEREKEYFINYFNLNDRRVNFDNSELTTGSSINYTIYVK